ncbi:MAG: hypothetical protein AAGJ46_15050 [Planctomycetota bacterium]
MAGRQAFWAGWKNPAQRKQARADFALKLLKRDNVMLSFSIAADLTAETFRQFDINGIIEGRLNEKLFRHPASRPSPGTGPAFGNWYSAARRGRRGVPPPTLVHDAFVKAEDEYLAYCLCRDRYEFFLAGREDEFFPTKESFAFYLARTGRLSNGSGGGFRSEPRAVAEVQKLAAVFNRDRFWRAVSAVRAAPKTKYGTLVNPTRLGLRPGQDALDDALFGLISKGDPEGWLKAVMYEVGHDPAAYPAELFREYGRDTVLDAAAQVIVADRDPDYYGKLTVEAAAKLGVFQNRYEHGAVIEMLENQKTAAAKAAPLVRVPAEIDGVTLTDGSGRGAAGVAVTDKHIVVLHHRADSRGATRGHHLAVIDRATNKLLHNVPVTPPGGLSQLKRLVVKGQTAVVQDRFWKVRPEARDLPSRLKKYTSVGSVVTVDLATGQRGPWLSGRLNRDGPYFTGSGFGRNVATSGDRIAVVTPERIGNNPAQKYTYVDGRIYVYDRRGDKPLYSVSAHQSDYGDRPRQSIEFGQELDLGEQFGVASVDHRGRGGAPAAVVFDAKTGRRVGRVPTSSVPGAVAAIAVHADRALIVANVVPPGRSSLDHTPTAYCVSLPEGRLLWETGPGKDSTHPQAASLSSNRAAFFNGNTISVHDASTGKVVGTASFIVPEPAPNQDRNRELPPKYNTATASGLGFATFSTAETGWFTPLEW